MCLISVFQNTGTAQNTVSEEMTKTAATIYARNYLNCSLVSEPDIRYVYEHTTEGQTVAREVEELTLYVIELQKRIEALEKE